MRQVDDAMVAHLHAVDNAKKALNFSEKQYFDQLMSSVSCTTAESEASTNIQDQTDTTRQHYRKFSSILLDAVTVGFHRLGSYLDRLIDATDMVQKVVTRPAERFITLSRGAMQALDRVSSVINLIFDAIDSIPRINMRKVKEIMKRRREWGSRIRVEGI